MRLWQRFASSKKARIVALAILGVAIFSYAAIILVSEIFGAGEDAGKVYRKLEGDRVLLMSTDNNSYCVISNQSFDCISSIPLAFLSSVVSTCSRIIQTARLSHLLKRQIFCKNLK